MDFRVFLRQFDIDTMEAIAYLQANDWFGEELQMEGGKLILTDAQQAHLSEVLTNYAAGGTSETLLQMMDERMPVTAGILRDVFKKRTVPEDDAFYLTDFLLFHLEKDIPLHTNEELVELLNLAETELTKSAARVLTLTLAYARSKYKTHYTKDFLVLSEKMEGTDAYSIEEYTKLLFHLFNALYITQHHMYEKACGSKKFIDTWLFLALHFVCALRFTDLERLYHPRLPDKPEVVLEQIKSGTFSDADARAVLLSITERLQYLRIKPHKRKKHTKTPPLKFIVPESCEVHMGKLFAIAEAHYQLTGSKGPLVQRINRKEAIRKNMGQEIGNLFRYENFKSRRANKSYLQAFELFAEKLHGEEADGRDVTHTKGYILAALARAHSTPRYSDFAQATAIYLKDHAFSGITAEHAAFLLYERGVCSWTTSMLLDAVTGGNFHELSAAKQTELIKKVNLTPFQIEKMAASVAVVRERCKEALKAVYSNGKDPLNVLEVVGDGRAFSKSSDNMCILTAINGICPDPKHRHCLTCEFEISTKATMYMIADEYKRIARLAKATEDKTEKAKYQHIATEILLPKLYEIFDSMEHTYGRDVREQYERIIYDYVS